MTIFLDDCVIDLECTFPRLQAYKFPALFIGTGAMRIFHNGSSIDLKRNRAFNAVNPLTLRARDRARARTHESWIICWMHYYVNGVRDVARVISRYWPAFFFRNEPLTFTLHCSVIINLYLVSWIKKHFLECRLPRENREACNVSVVTLMINYALWWSPRNGFCRLYPCFSLSWKYIIISIYRNILLPTLIA